MFQRNSQVYALIFTLALTVSVRAAEAPPVVKVFKTRTCGCCAKWVEHLRANGFAPQVTEVPSTAEYRRQYGVPEGMQSCHTATVGGYTIEGHVPAADVARLLKSKPKAKGLAVPGMPMGSPGMEGARRDAYAVYLFQADGQVSVFQKYAGE